MAPASAASTASVAINTCALPVPGTYKQFTQVSTTTGYQDIQMGAGVNVITTAGSTFNLLKFQGLGHTVNLFAVSSATWVATNAGSGLTFSTY